MTKAIPFTAAGLARAIVGAKKAGLRVTGIRPDGTLLVDDGDSPLADVTTVPAQEESEDALQKRWGDDD